jgi:ribosomal RNA-processing protein 12
VIDEDDEENMDLLSNTNILKKKKEKIKEEEFKEENGLLIIPDDTEEKPKSKKRQREDEVAIDDFDEDDLLNPSKVDEKIVVDDFKRPIKKIKKNNNESFAKFGEEYKSNKKAGGDIKKGKVDPYAYITLDPSRLNKRKKLKNSNFHKFDSITRAARKGFLFFLKNIFLIGSLLAQKQKRFNSLRKRKN